MYPQVKIQFHEISDSSESSLKCILMKCDFKKNKIAWVRIIRKYNEICFHLRVRQCITNLSKIAWFSPEATPKKSTVPRAKNHAEASGVPSGEKQKTCVPSGENTKLRLVFSVNLRLCANWCTPCQKSKRPFQKNYCYVPSGEKLTELGGYISR